MPVVEMHTKYLRSAKYDDLLTIQTQLRELPTGHRIEFHHIVYNEAGKMLTTGRVVLYFLNATTMARTVMPPELLNRLQTYFK
jgi:acyl-CoA thioester hydrolase